jgi:ferredoxin-NADP reductase
VNQPASTEWAGDAIVADKRLVADGVAELRLARPDGIPLPPWQPGAHIDLMLPNGLERQYSLCGDPRDTGTWRIGVLRSEDGAGSAYVHDQLAVGGSVRLRGPRNHFPLVPARRYLFLAGGIGITPLLPMIREVEASGRTWSLHYGGRSRSSMAFVDELVGHSAGQVDIVPANERGLLDLARILGRPDPDTAVYCCGPEPLLQAAEERCAAWPTGALHVERFAPKTVVADGPERELMVRLATSDRTVRVPVGVSILEAIERAGVQVLSSCREGTCGTCETGVLEGVPDHRDSLLTEDERAEGTFMMICVSRAKSDQLVLDL